MKTINVDPRLEKLPLFNLIVFSTVINIVTIVLGLVSRFFLPPLIPIFFGLPQTDEQLASSIYILIPPTITVLLTFINIAISLKIQSNYNKRVLAFTTFALSILSTIAVVKIILLVGSF